MANYGTISDNGDTSVVRVNGPFIFKAVGTWGSGTFVVKFLGADESTYDSFVIDTDMVSDSTGEKLFDIPENVVMNVKATLSGATSPSLRWQFLGNVLP